MSGNWDPFQPPAELAKLAIQQHQAATQRHEAEQALTRAVFGSPHGAAWLAQRLAQDQAQPSYRPGDSFDQVAWHEGRKAVIRDIEAMLKLPALPAEGE